MSNIIVVSQGSGGIIAKRVKLADTFFMRLKGLLGKEELKEDEGLLIKPCNCVHSFGMKFSIDVVFLNGQGGVISVLPDFKPNKISPAVKGAKMVLELPIGTIDQISLKEGQILSISTP